MENKIDCEKEQLTFPKWAYRKPIFWLMVIGYMMWHPLGKPFMMSVFLGSLAASFFLNTILFFIIYSIKQSRMNKQKEKYSIKNAGGKK